MNTDKLVYIVDDDAQICQSLRCLLESTNLNVETYDNPSTFLANYNPSRQGCLVLDVRMPLISGIDLLNKLNLEKKYLPSIVISGFNDIPVVVKAMQAGAVDFILKPINTSHLLKTINYHLEKSVQKQPFNFTPRLNFLTKREQEVMNLILDGKFNKQIADELKISISTVEAHRSRIMVKFQAKNLAQLIKNYFNIPDYFYK